jgi:predicted tellurium resistance membrane protein TerC
MISLRYILYKEINMVDNLTHMMAVGTGWVAILMPVLLIWVCFYFATKMDKAKYESMVEIAKNLEDPSDVEDLLENFKEKKKPIDYRRTGVITIFVGLGLFLFGLVSISILKGVGLLVICVGVGSLVAGYIYPNNSHEIAEAVEKFEKK